jgi:chromosome segregation ATPase
MIIINPKRVRALKKENDELKSSLIKISERQGSIAQLDEMLRRIRSEIAELQNQKVSYLDALQKLKETETKTRVQADELKKEVGQLKELRNQEHKDVITMTDHLSLLKEFNGNGHGNSTAQTNPLYSFLTNDEIISAEKKKSELQREIGSLQNKLKELYQRIVELTEQEQFLEADINKKTRQLESIESFRLIDAKDELNEIENKIKERREFADKAVFDFEQRIKKLSEYEKELQGRIISSLGKLEDIQEKPAEAPLVHHLSADKNSSLVTEEQKLIESIEAKKFLIDSLNNDISALELKKEELSRLPDTSKPEAIPSSLQQDLTGTVEKLQNEALKLSDAINQLKMTEELKRELISNLKDELSAKEIEFAALENDFNTKSNQLKEISIKNQELAEEIRFRNKQLSTINESLSVKNSHLKDYEEKIPELVKQIAVLENEIAQCEIIKSGIESKANRENELINSLEAKRSALENDIQSLAAKQKQLHENNKVFENRFASLFEKYSKSIDDMNKKRKVLEQMIQKKEKDIFERDEKITEKLAVLEETDNVLLIRQKEIDSFDDLLKVIKDQKKLLIGDIKNLNYKSIEKKLENQELKVESEVLQKKLAEFEKSLLELFGSADIRLKKSYQQKEKLDTEIKEYESRLKALNNNLKDSMNELVELRETIGNIKVEHEEHRIEINKLAAIRNKLLEDINKGRVIADKYNKILERIRHEKEAIKKRREEIIYGEPESKVSDYNNFKKDEITKIFKL